VEQAADEARDGGLRPHGRVASSVARAQGEAARIRLLSIGQQRAEGVARSGIRQRDMGLDRIAPAEAIVGDLLMLPGVDRLGGLAIALGNGRVVAYHEDVAAAAVLQPLQYLAAWRTL
jgi:hypothetical protein